MTNFTDFNLHPNLLKSLERMQYKEASPIQAQTMPIILEGKDLIALAQTGSGKTAACAIPICQQIDTSQNTIQALIVVPTRELALQYATEAQKIGYDLGVKVFALYGGEKMDLQHSKLKNGVHILIATPGRLIDFIYERAVDLSSVKTLVMDEADEMLSMGFLEDLEFIIGCLVQEHQTLLFSATMPNAIRNIAKQHMKSPAEIALTRDNASPQKLEHRFVYCHPRERDHRLMELLKEQEPVQALIFCQSREHCEALCRMMHHKFQKVDFLHAGLAQDMRNMITNKFRSGKIRYLVATDVAARGLDFSKISHVYMPSLPRDPEVYVHRAGRTGRNDKEGMCVTLVGDRDLSSLEKVLKLVDRPVSWIGEPPREFPPKHHRRPPPRRGPPRPRAPQRRNLPPK